MRIEIEIADELPEAQALKSLTDPRGYLLRLVRLDIGSPVSTSDSEPDYAAIFREAQNSPSAFKTREEADAYIESLRNEWHESA